MNYKSIYESLMMRGLNRPFIKGEHERHHILPKSLGGSNLKSNISILTPREHLIAHMLLVRIYSGSDRSKMAWALHRMSFGTGRKMTSWEYEYVRKIHAFNVSGPKSDATKKRMSGSKSPEHTDKLRVSARRNSKIAELVKDDDFQKKRIKALKDSYPEGTFKGRQHSDETKEKIRKSRIGKTSSIETKKILSDMRSGEGNNMYGKKHSEQAREKMRLAWENRKKRNCFNG